MGNEMDVVDIIKQNKRFGVVEGKEAVYEKIDELSKKDFDRAVEALRKAGVPPPYKAIIAP